jgi:hypothetical protein
MTNHVKNLRAKLARRDKRIAALMEENIQARQLIQDAIIKARMIARENEILKNNAKIRPRSARVARRMDDLHYAETILKHIKSAVQTGNAFIHNYENQSRRTL